jgi:hypothetical protein
MIFLLLSRKLVILSVAFDAENTATGPFCSYNRHFGGVVGIELPAEIDGATNASQHVLLT